MGKLTPGLTGTVVVIALAAGGAMCRAAALDPAGADANRLKVTSARGLTAEEFSSQSKKILHRAPRRIRIYGPREPGPNSVRICSSHYEYEYRLSGTVIVPRVNCYWSG